MPTGLVEDHDRVFVLADCRSQVVEELLHRLGVGARAKPLSVPGSMQAKM
jgi:hypothetical protein